MRARIRPRLDQWKKYIKLARIGSDQALARRMGIGRTSVSRVLRQGGDVGIRFVTGALVAFPELGFDDLFVLTVDNSATPPKPTPQANPGPARRPLADGSRNQAPRPQGPLPR